MRPPQVEQKTFEVIKELAYDNLEGGAWRQGWDVATKKSGFYPRKKQFQSSAGTLLQEKLGVREEQILQNSSTSGEVSKSQT